MSRKDAPVRCLDGTFPWEQDEAKNEITRQLIVLLENGFYSVGMGDVYYLLSPRLSFLTRGQFSVYPKEGFIDGAGDRLIIGAVRMEEVVRAIKTHLGKTTE